jgi:hypothetical protein
LGKHDDPEFEVGYKKPPLHTRFKPGHSGNLGGRPKKKAQTYVEAFEKELARTTSINIGGKTRRISMIELMAKQHIARAVKGDTKAAQLVISIVRSLGSDGSTGLPPIIDMLRSIHAGHEALSAGSPESGESGSDAPLPLTDPGVADDET